MLVQIEYTLSFTAPFHMGTGNSTNALDRTVVRDTNDRLYVPASTFKGVLREECERLLNFYTTTVEIASPHDTDAVLSEFGQAPRLISRIFGSQLHPGTLYFTDIKPDKDVYKNYQNIQSSFLTQVRIDRSTGTAADQALYTSEFGNSILSFKGTMKGKLDCTSIDDLKIEVEEQNKIQTFIPTYSLLLLLAGILMVERIGSNKSTGKGQCSCLIDEMRLDGQKCREKGEEGQKGWRWWLEHLDVLSSYKQKGEDVQR